jgi:hypothetical protein
MGLPLRAFAAASCELLIQERELDGISDRGLWGLVLIF